MRLLVTGGLERNTQGQFKRKHLPWSLESFDDGYVDATGRMRVYRPDHPRSSSNGYIMRSIVAYEAYHGITVERGFEIHHKDENRLNDSIENLEMINGLVHARMHSHLRKKFVGHTCVVCKNVHYISQWRTNQGRGKYCSQICFRNRGSRL